MMERNSKPLLQASILQIAGVALLLAVPCCVAQCSECSDTAPDDQWTCQQQRSFGACSQSWMKGFCKLSCGECSCGTGTLDIGYNPRPSPPNPVSKPASQDHTPPQATSSTQKDQPQPAEDGSCTYNVASYLSSVSNITTVMQQALQAAGLWEQLQQPSVKVTVFVPTDAAWQQVANDSQVPLAALTADNTTMSHVALYHVLPKAVAPDQLTSQPYWQPYWDGRLLFANRKVYISGEGTEARIIRNKKVCSSYVYLIDYVLLPSNDIMRLPPFKLFEPAPAVAAAPPPPPCVPSDTAWFTIINNPNLTETARAIQTAGLVGVLNNSKQTLTVLAPDNVAWQNAPIQLKQDATRARATLLLHVLPVSLPSKSLPQGALYRTMNQKAEPIFIGRTSGGVLQVQTLAGSDAVLLATDLGHSCNATVHMISAVLNPGDAAATSVALPPNVTASNGPK